MQSDPFDEILGLEEQFYDEGYEQGMADGIKTGRIGGRTFGLEKGFEKYVAIAKLHGKSIVWANRLPQLQNRNPSTDQKIKASHLETPTKSLVANEAGQPLTLPLLSDNRRLVKHVKVMYALTEPGSLATENTEEAVSDFDDRLKRAQARAKIIERISGEDILKADSDGPGKVVSSNDGSIEDVSVLNARH